jgi:hypothetical protein
MRIGIGRFVLAALFVGCSKPEHAGALRDAANAKAMASIPPKSIASGPIFSPPDASPSIAFAMNDGSAEGGGDAANPPKKYAVVLHAGDSMVGGFGGLTKALGAKFRGEGSRFVTDSWTSTSIAAFDHSNRFKNLIDRNKPDLVILTLGTNDVFVPFPQALAGDIEAIVKKIGNRDCVWIGPPTWKPDTGIVNVIREHAAPCKFFDSSMIKLHRAGDGIHPTNEGGVEWADQFWTFFRGPSSP